MTAVLEQSNRLSITLLDNDMRLIDSKRFTVTYQMFSMADEDDFGQQSFNQNKAFLKINVFLNTMVDNSVAFRIEDMAKVERFLAEYDNNLMVLPDLDDITLLECFIELATFTHLAHILCVCASCIWCHGPECELPECSVAWTS